MPSSRLVQRWLVAYLLLYVLFFPLWHLTDIFPWLAVHEYPWVLLVKWVGAAVFAVDAAPRPDSSLGDQTYFFVSLACRLVATTLLALVWSPTARQLERVRSYVALYLAADMIMYGWFKVLPTQMPAFAPDRAILPFGDTNPQGLLWTFMGVSPPFQIASGLAEVTAGMLLFWRPTRPLGATLTLAVMSYVLLLNFCFDVGVKLHSIHL